MPLAAGAHRGTAGQELVIEILLVTLSVAIVGACVLVLWGLRGGRAPRAREGTGPARGVQARPDR